jgi:hypothetical protein
VDASGDVDRDETRAFGQGPDEGICSMTAEPTPVASTSMVFRDGQ